jgi:hypothetical protein
MQYRTILTYPGTVAFTDDKGRLRDPDNLYTWAISGEYTDSTNILGLVFFSGNHTILRRQCTVEHRKVQPYLATKMSVHYSTTCHKCF